jgi:hypothetical protein
MREGAGRVFRNLARTANRLAVVPGPGIPQLPVDEGPKPFRGCGIWSKDQPRAGSRALVEGDARHARPFFVPNGSHAPRSALSNPLLNGERASEPFPVATRCPNDY